MRSEDLRIDLVLDAARLPAATVHRGIEQRMLQERPSRIVIYLPGLRSPQGNARDRKQVRCITEIILQALELGCQVLLFSHVKNTTLFMNEFAAVSHDLRLHQYRLQWCSLGIRVSGLPLKYESTVMTNMEVPSPCLSCCGAETHSVAQHGRNEVIIQYYRRVLQTVLKGVRQLPGVHHLPGGKAESQAKYEDTYVCGKMHEKMTSPRLTLRQRSLS